MKNKKLYAKALIIVLTTLAIPIILNYILQIHVVDSIIGNSVTWLSFWGNYIALIASSIMTYFAYRTIQVTIKTHKSNLCVHWHDNLRTTIVQLRTTLNLTKLNDIRQDLYDGKRDVDSIKKSLLQMQVDYNAASSNLEYLLIDREVLYKDKKYSSQVDAINKAVAPFSNYISVMTMLASMIDGIEKGSYEHHNLDEIIEMQDESLRRHIKDNMFGIKDVEAIKKQVLFGLSQELENFNFDELNTALSKIYKYDSFNAMNTTFSDNQ